LRKRTEIIEGMERDLFMWVPQKLSMRGKQRCVNNKWTNETVRVQYDSMYLTSDMENNILPCHSFMLRCSFHPRLPNYTHTTQLHPARALHEKSWTVLACISSRDVFHFCTYCSDVPFTPAHNYLILHLFTEAQSKLGNLNLLKAYW
jgi:hypothetical protein